MAKFEYSESQVLELEKLYLAGETLEKLAELFKTSVASCRMKLVARKVYRAKTKSAKTKSAKTTQAVPTATNLTPYILANISLASQAPTSFKNLGERKIHDQWILSMINEFGKPNF